MQIRDFPASLYDQLVQSAKVERRSLARQATALIERALSVSGDQLARRRELLT